jgi:hypothetical protein
MDPKQRQSPGNGADHTNGATGDDSPVGEGSNAPLKRRRITVGSSSLAWLVTCP